jgi:hypothetical protein
MNPTLNLLGDPKYIGPGVWYIIHLRAKEATNEKAIDEFMKFMYMLAGNFVCKKCRKHMTDYIVSHPMEDLKNLKNEKGVNIGMFKWAWLFHNAVNTRIHKPIVDWDTAWEMYDNPEVCDTKCDEGEKYETEENTPENTKPENTKTGDIKTFIVDDTKNNINDRRARLAQGYFMSIGIPKKLENSVKLTETVSFI